MAKIHTNTQKPFNYRLLAFILACCFGIFFSIPSFFQDSSKYPFFDGYKKITLGLDLQGGLSLLLDVDVNEAVGNKYSSMLSDLKHQTDKTNIFINKLRMQGDSISFILLDSSRTKDMESILSNMEGVVWSQSGNTFSIALNEEAIKKVQKNALDQAIFTIRNRLSGFGLTEPNVLR